MESKEALRILENTCLTFMVHISKETRPKILEAADVLRELLPNDEPKEEKKDK